MSTQAENSSNQSIGHYERGATTYFASKHDPRMGYYLYVPKGFDFSEAEQYRLCVVVHGTGRTPSHYRDLFADFAENNNAIVVAPLFPAGLIEDGDLSNYKFIKFQDIRFDVVLLNIIEQVASRYGLTEKRFLLFGFSGGGQFVHRFAYLHARALLGLSVGAPGMVTLIDSSRPWWQGTSDFAERFEAPLDLDGLRAIPVQMVVGGDDTETWEITITPSSRYWMEGANDAGATRIDRLRTLHRNFGENGIVARFDTVPGVAHNGYAVLGPVQDFFAEVLRLHRVGASTLSAAGPEA